MNKDDMIPRQVAEAMARLGPRRVAETESMSAALAPVISEFVQMAVSSLIEPLTKRMAELEGRPALRYRNLWNVDEQYNEGDLVTDKGALWFCKTSTRERPGGSEHWQLSVKRGGNGLSAYDVARKLGFRGSEREWLDSLKGGSAK